MFPNLGSPVQAEVRFPFCVLSKVRLVVCHGTWHSLNRAGSWETGPFMHDNQSSESTRFGDE